MVDHPSFYDDAKDAQDPRVIQENRLFDLVMRSFAGLHSKDEFVEVIKLFEELGMLH